MQVEQFVIEIDKLNSIISGSASVDGSWVRVSGVRFHARIVHEACRCFAACGFRHVPEKISELFRVCGFLICWPTVDT